MYLGKDGEKDGKKGRAALEVAVVLGTDFVGDVAVFLKFRPSSSSSDQLPRVVKLVAGEGEFPAMQSCQVSTKLYRNLRQSRPRDPGRIRNFVI